MRDPADEWRAAATFADLCALGERFVRGELRLFPGWGAPDLDEESDALGPTLARSMRGGLFTTASQPGRPFAPGHDGRAWGQRAFVCGFAHTGAVALLAEAARARGLWLLCPGPGAEATPVGLADGRPYLFAGHAARDEELELFAGEVGERALQELEAQTFVWCVDPVWGRRAALIEALAAAFG